MVTHLIISLRVNYVNAISYRGVSAHRCAHEPGPDFFFVSQTAVSRSRKEAMMGVLGITMGVMVWAAVALLGLNLILAKMAWLHNIIMVGGGFTFAGWATRCCAGR